MNGAMARNPTSETFPPKIAITMATVETQTRASRVANASA